MGSPLTGAERQARYRARHPEREARRARLRVRVGRLHVGYAPTPEHAADLNQMGRDFAAQQKGLA